MVLIICIEGWRLGGGGLRELGETLSIMDYLSLSMINSTYWIL